MMAAYLKGEGTIICLEPDPTNLIELRANVAGNHLEPSITILPVAAGSADGVISFEPGLNAHAAENGSMQVEVRRLDSLNLPQVNFIKIDVEGFEGSVLDGAQALIERCHPTLFLELHAQLLTAHTHGEIVQFLQRHYTRISVYQAAHGNGWMRILQSYGLVSCLKRLDKLPELVAAYEAGAMEEHTSWIVAQA
jgi:FkbM family methyltransferase